MLASTATSVTEAVDELGDVVVQAKLDGIRLQVHKDGGEVSLYTRNLNNVTDRLPVVVELVRTFSADSCVLDGELIGVSDCLLYTSPSPRDRQKSRMPSSA